MPRLALRNSILAPSAIALASCLTGLLPASAASADRPATKAETAAIKHAVLTGGETCRPHPAGPCDFRHARVSTHDARFAWADVVREGFSGALLKRPTARSLRFRVIGTQGGGIGECSYWRALAPAAVLRDLDVVGVIDDSGRAHNCGKSPNPPASPAASRVTLGSKRFASEVPQYQGAGRVRPKVIGDGNTCEGQASQLKWKHWGSTRATATGSMCDSPQGCTSACAQQSSAQAVAYDLGRCTAHGPRVYRRAKARVRDVDTGEWSRWSSLNTFGASGRLCRSTVK